MDITTRDYKRVNIIRVTGRVDANTLPKFDEKLQEYVRSGRAQLVVEMDGTTFLSSAGVRALISANKALKARGGRLAIAQPSERVREVLRIAGLESLFPIYNDTEAAVGAV